MDQEPGGLHDTGEWQAASTGRPPGSNRRAGVIAVGIAVAAFAVGVVAYLAAPLLQERLPQAAYRLIQGDCFDLPDENQAEVTEVQRRPCAEPHDAEVLAVVIDPLGGQALPSGAGVFIDPTAPYPGIPHFLQVADEQCTPIEAAFLGISPEQAFPADLESRLFYPGAEIWADGKRSITCYATRADGTSLTRSLRGIGSSPLPQ